MGIDQENSINPTDTIPQLVLVLGGARSGKSTFAERLAQSSGKSVAFIATATASDDEMRERIQRHRAGRPPEWHTIEMPLYLAEAVRRAAEVADVLLLDCVTIWLTNWLLSQGMAAPTEAQTASARLEDQAISTQYSDSALAEVEALLRIVASLDQQKKLIVVTNEVGLGIVPSYALGRVYRDVLGLVNQRFAAAASRVYMMVAGLAVDIKRLHEEAKL